MNISNLISIIISVAAILISTLNSFLNFRQNSFTNQSLKADKTSQVVDMFLNEVVVVYDTYIDSEMRSQKEVVESLPSGADLVDDQTTLYVLELVSNILITDRIKVLNVLERASLAAVTQPILLESLYGSIGFDFLEIFTKFESTINEFPKHKFNSIRILRTKFSKYNLGDERND
ncbi:MAG: hypothetical protein LBM27_04850 [Lactobacillaceae bacterium]|jgi:hypothetical protein|nr:hypothetical protein [Lactobacillaceae bacterium]